MSEIADKFKEQIEAYRAPREQGDTDLVSEVRNILKEVGLHEKLSAYDGHRYIKEAINKSSNIQRYHLNRYWSLQLMMSDKQSIEERYCLIPNGSNNEWLKLFKTKVLPFILENNLPIKV